MKNNTKRAFTLAELLIALGIIGAIAAIAIPSVWGNLNNKILVTSLKNNVANIQNLVGTQLVLFKTKKISSTDFSAADKLLKDENFNIVRNCEATLAQKDCWKTKGEGTNAAKVKYRYIASNTVIEPEARQTVILSNGSIMSYEPPSDSVNYGIVQIDTNGNDAPNIVGRDFFEFRISEDGRVIGNDDTDANNLTKCKSNSALACFTNVIRANWKIEY